MTSCIKLTNGHLNFLGGLKFSKSVLHMQMFWVCIFTYTDMTYEMQAKYLQRVNFNHYKSGLLRFVMFWHSFQA